MVWPERVPGLKRKDGRPLQRKTCRYFRRWRRFGYGQVTDGGQGLENLNTAVLDVTRRWDVDAGSAEG